MNSVTFLSTVLSTVAAMSMIAPDPDPTGLPGHPAVPVNAPMALAIGPDDVVEPVVERTSAGIITITGATYAVVHPTGRVLQGIEIPLASMSWQTQQGEPIIYAVDPRQAYQVQTAVYYLPDGSDNPYDALASFFTVELGVSRIDKVQRLIEIGVEANEIKAELGEIEFFEYVEAINRWRAQNEVEGAHPTGPGAAALHEKQLERYRQDIEDAAKAKNKE